MRLTISLKRVVIVYSVILSTVGCGGPSTEDLMMRAAMRSRGRDGSEEQDKKVSEAETAKREDATKTVAESSQLTVPIAFATGSDAIAAEPVQVEVLPNEAVKLSAPVVPAETVASLSELSIKPIDERERDGAADEQARRTRAVANLTRIAEALEKYHEEKGRYPSPIIKTQSGIATLSWRVTLLPYLGYNELFKKFDPSRPWNYEPNKSLLQYIPDVYVSPERFDVKTNLQLPAYRTFMFGDGRGRSKHEVDQEDGSENTILLLEVNDELAVEWTKPMDYVPTSPSNVKSDLGKVRGDGTFAVWANGWTVLLANGLSQTQLFNALTFDAGDGQLAGLVHRDIPLAGATDAASAVVTNQSGDASESVDSPYHRFGGSVEPVTRDRVPIAGDLAKAQSRLRGIYMTKIVEAKKDADKSQLASEMLDRSSEMTADPAGAFALQTAAIKLSGDAGEIDPILKAVDQRVGRFEVDAYEQNMKALLKFAESNTRRDADEVDGNAFLNRCIPVIFAAINDDDYVRASALARHSYRLSDQEPDEEMMKSLNRLRVLLSSAQREYDKASVSLSNFRDDPALVNDAATFGRFACFIKGDWQTGLPLVAMGEPKSLSELAKRDLQGAKNYFDEVAIGDAWWNVSEGIRNGVYRQSLQDRAAYWYRLAWPVMPDSLDRIHVKNRLDELQGLSATSPLALIKQLAEDAGVDLSTSLSSIANVGQGRGVINSEDDDD